MTAPRPRSSNRLKHGMPAASVRRVAIVGAGMAGIACARTLAQAGHAVTVFERAPHSGGRTAALASPFGSFDTGAQYFTVRDARFQRALDTARELGFGTVERENSFVSAKYNDGIQVAADPAYNPRPADYIVPCGSDDWVDYRLFLDLPNSTTVVGFQRLSFVRPDGLEMVQRTVQVPGGCGIRIYPSGLMASLDYRPADEDRRRACDTSILTNLRRAVGFHIEHRDLDPKQIVDWKSRDIQLNPYESLTFHRTFANPQDPFEALADLYPAVALMQMAEHYGRVRSAVLA